MMVDVREAEPEEHDEVGHVTADAYREFVPPDDDDWKRYLDHIADVSSRAERTVIIVAVEDDRILGSATLELEGRVEREPERELDPGEAHIRMLGVAPAARGRGIATQLMAECEERAAAAGRTLMTLNTTARMQAAQRMYAKLGYKRGEDHVFPDGFVLLSYEKRL